MLNHALGHGLPGSVQRFVSNSGRRYGDVVIPAGQIDRYAMYKFLIDNNVIREDAGREIDRTLVEVARRDLVAWQDAANVGDEPTEKGLGTQEHAFDRVAPVGEAEQGMSILNLGDADRATFQRAVIPVPVTSRRFRLDARHIASGRGMGPGVDVTNIEENTRSVSEKLEDTITNGSDVTMDANGLPGYTNLSCREQLSFSAGSWASGPTGFAGAIADVIAMRAALRENGFRGPYNLYLPSNFDGVLDDDYKAESDRTLRERILAMDGISAIKIAPALPDSNVLLVQMTRSVVHIVSGQGLTVVTWDEFGGLATNWAIIAVQAPVLKCAYARAPLSEGVLPALTTATGIAHLS